MSFGQSGGSKPVFSRWQHQEEGIEKIFSEIIGPRLLGGSPDVLSEAASRRARQATRRDFAGRGMSGSGLEARAIGQAQVQGAQAREAQLMDLIQTAIAPLGQAQKGGFQIGLSGGS